ncbi:MAG: right-handed parallel beta-helix repeat-containing protein [Planctomycetota bacterium]|nr:right-handed parallel beta-helix repeat-containing protein [Planctomycetota bacterium]
MFVIVFGGSPRSTSAQTIIYVDATAPGAGNGTTWSTSYRFLQDALADAATFPEFTSVEIRVAQGFYRPDQRELAPGGTGSRAESFLLLEFVSIQGGFAGLTEASPDDRNVILYPTILSGDLLENDVPEFLNMEENVFHVVAADAGVLDGVTIQGGNADAVVPNNYGAGMVIQGGGPLVRNCIFRWNRCTGDGAAVHISKDNGSRFFDCRFEENYAQNTGGAIRSVFSSPEFVRCDFISNTADSSGGAVVIDNSGCPDFWNCRFLSNNGNGGDGGGAVANTGSCTSIFANCLFAGNFGVDGGAIMCDAGIVNVYSSTFVANSTSDDGGAIALYSNGTEIDNSIFWGNTPDEISTGFSVATLRACDVQGGWAGAGSGNIDLDPMFLDVDGPDDDLLTLEDNNYRLMVGSPCIDQADAMNLPTDTSDVDGDGDDFELLPVDLDDTPRVLNLNLDMGAYESDHCPADSDGSGGIEVLDLLDLLAKWGLCSVPCPEDNDGSGTVDVLDLLDLLAAWGACP